MSDQRNLILFEFFIQFGNDQILKIGIIFHRFCGKRKRDTVTLSVKSIDTDFDIFICSQVIFGYDLIDYFFQFIEINIIADLEFQRPGISET